MEIAHKQHEATSITAYAMQLIGFLGVPVVWAIEFIFSYSITQHACSTGRYWQLYLLSISALALAGAITFIAFRNFRLTTGNEHSSGGSALDRTRFMAIVGLLTSTFFTVVILAEALPRFVLSPCD